MAGVKHDGEAAPTVRAEGVSVRYRADQEFVSDLQHAIELVNVGEVDSDLYTRAGTGGPARVDHAVRVVNKGSFTSSVWSGDRRAQV